MSVVGGGGGGGESTFQSLSLYISTKFTCL